MKDITKIYKMGSQKIYALDNVNIDIDQNEYVALMGPSGSGKSTLMNILGCLDTPDRGSYSLNGVEISSLNDSKLASIRNREIGFIFQTFNLLPRLTALDNVALPLVYANMNSIKRKERAEKVLERVGLGDRMKHKPNELSGGQRQRVAIARALVNNPAILLADEPTGNLDTKTSLEIMDIFQDLYESGNTIVVVTHEPDIAEYAQRKVLMRDGKIVEDSLHAYSS